MVPQHLQIRVIHADDDIVVIDKPANLRSVPGHADSPTDTTVKLKRPSNRLSAAEAWVAAIKNIPVNDHRDAKGMSESVVELLHNIRTTNNPSSIPRKREPFARYVFRNRKRLLSPHHVDDMADSMNEPPQKKQKRNCDSSVNKKQSIPPSFRKAADEAFSFIQKLHLPLMNLPTPTDDCESALGQLRLLGFGDFANEHNNKSSVSYGSEKSKLYVVHRLDCQTSGVMVFARNPETASKLCEAWRERNSVEKKYLAHVMRWPPYQDEMSDKGVIELPLAASRTERIKWEVRDVNDGGKSSITKWKIYKDTNANSSNRSNEGVILELSPVTGRTHQLRIHCAAIGSGIVNDSLYGDSKVPWFKERQEASNQSETETSSLTVLRLHAHVLSFRHPRTGDKMTFQTPKLW